MDIPLTGVVLFIAFGTMIFIMVFCFVKRQITRFKLRSSHRPHALIGFDAPQPLQDEIARRLRRVKDIVLEPQLLNPELEQKLTPSVPDPHHFVYRMKAVDALSLLDEELKKCRPTVVRCPSMQLKAFLLEQRLNGVLEGCKLDLIEKFTSSYDHARHDPKDFSQADYQQFMDLLNHLLSHIHSKSSVLSSGDDPMLIQCSLLRDTLKPEKGGREQRIDYHDIKI